MNIHFPISTERIKHFCITAACAVIAIYFVVHSVTSERGLITLSNTEFQLSKANLELEEAMLERKKLEARTRLLRQESLDLDLLDERARATMGYTKPNEYVIIYDNHHKK